MSYSGKDEVLQVGKAKIDSCCSQKVFLCQPPLFINSIRDEKVLSRIKKELKQA